MVTKKRMCRFFAIALVFMLTLQAIILGTAAFAENREKEITTNLIFTETTAESPIDKKEIYDKEKIDQLAKDYDVEPEYLHYIAETEKTFGLEPYELFALIAQESGFVSQTKMDGGSLSYSTTQMKMPTAKTAHMAITEYYKKDIPYPTHEKLAEDKYYATMLAGGYLKYLHDTYNDKHESYTAYRWGIGGRLTYYQKHGNYQSFYALKVAELNQAFAKKEI